MKLKNLILISLSFGTSSAWAGPSRPISNLELYVRCYQQISRMRPDLRSPDYVQVKAGQKDPIQACLQLLDLAKLSRVEGDQILLPNANDMLSRNILKTVNDLHLGFFSNRDLSKTGYAGALPGTRSVYDETEPGLILTRALLAPNARADEILTGSTAYRGVRVSVNPAVFWPSYIGNNSMRITQKTLIAGDSGFGGMAPYPVTQRLSDLTSIGQLVGIEKMPSIVVPATSSPSNPFAPQGGSPIANFNLNFHAGGGIIGSPMFFMLNSNMDNVGFRSNGGLHMPRRWSKYVLQDLLCLDLPNLKAEDVQVYPNSTIPFRKSVSCMQCHSSMDPMAAAVRKMGTSHSIAVGTGMETNGPSNFNYFHKYPTSQPAENGIQERDDWFAFRPPNGQLKFRGFDGRLVDRAVVDNAGLASAIREQPEFYQCLAKKYYRYFTNTDIAMTGRAPSSTAEFHRAQIMSLGQRLQQHQSLKRLIEDILRSPTYKANDFLSTVGN